MYETPKYNPITILCNLYQILRKLEKLEDYCKSVGEEGILYHNIIQMKENTSQTINLVVPEEFNTKENNINE